jgi:hypothetical protein
MVTTEMNSYEHNKPNSSQKEWATADLSAREMQKHWESIKWKEIHKQISKLQHRITKAIKIKIKVAASGKSG